jgi:hypothetical protein
VRPSDRLLVALALAWLALVGCWLHATLRLREADGHRAAAAMVRRLGLTDLALFTEARYTRHPTQADRFAPFQDHPGALEHFPTGSVVAPPEGP